MTLGHESARPVFQPGNRVYLCLRYHTSSFSELLFSLVSEPSFRSWLKLPSKGMLVFIATSAMQLSVKCNLSLIPLMPSSEGYTMFPVQRQKPFPWLLWLLFTVAVMHACTDPAGRKSEMINRLDWKTAAESLEDGKTWDAPKMQHSDIESSMKCMRGWNPDVPFFKYKFWTQWKIRAHWKPTSSDLGRGSSE